MNTQNLAVFSSSSEVRHSGSVSCIARQADKPYFSNPLFESLFKSLPVAKASGPDGLSNRVLRELSKELSVLYCSVFN